MIVLVTRPEPDNRATADKLRALGHEALLAPMLRFEAVPFEPVAADAFSGAIVTSANALRAVAGNPSLTKLKLYAVGERTASVARRMASKASKPLAAMQKLCTSLSSRAGKPRPAPRRCFIWLVRI